MCWSSAEAGQVVTGTEIRTLVKAGVVLVAPASGLDLVLVQEITLL
jgi:hypothetical protein